MNFFHVPSFEDHHTLKIWLKNWNLPVNNLLFKTIQKLNSMLNNLVDMETLKNWVDYEILQDMLPNKKWLEDKLRIQVYIKDDMKNKEELASHFYRNMHFMVALVEIESSQECQIDDMLNSIKKFAFLKDIKSLIIIAVCKTELAELVILQLDNAISISSCDSIARDEFMGKMVSVFMKSLRDKLRDIPKIDKHKVLCSLNEFNTLIRRKPSSFSEAKVFKLRGDVSCILGSVDDGLNYYRKALEIFKIEKRNAGSTKAISLIKMWIASIKESIGACHYNRVKKDSVEINYSSENAKVSITETIKNSNEALSIYKEEGYTLMAYELKLKLIGLYSLLKDKPAFIKLYDRFILERNQKDFDPRVLLYIGDLAHSIGLSRLAACSLYEASQMLKNSMEFSSVRKECLQLIARILKMDLESYKNNFGLLDHLPQEVAYVLLVNLLDMNQTNKNNPRMLHYYVLLLRNYEIERTFKIITEQVLWEGPFTEHEYDALPYIQRIVPENRDREYKLIKLNEEGSEKLGDSIFIYDPRSRSRYVELNWVANEEANITVYLTNPLPLETRIDSLNLETKGIEVVNYSKDIILAPFSKNYECKFKIRPLTTGTMSIRGVNIRIGNLVYTNTIDTRGIGNIYKYIKADNPFIYEQHYTNSDLNLEKITVAESVPIINVQSRNYCPDILFYNENVKMQYRFTNSSKKEAIDFYITVKVDYENAYTVFLERKFKGLVLKNNQSIDFDLCLHQGEGTQNNNTSDEMFELMDDERIVCYFENRNLIERVYKITIVIEARFAENEDYICSKEIVKIFKVI